MPSTGASLPRLSELRLVESVVPCVRDLGTGLARLVVLRLPHCKLSDLDGLPSLPSLQVSVAITERDKSRLTVTGAVHCPQ